MEGGEDVGMKGMKAFKLSSLGHPYYVELFLFKSSFR